MGLQRTQYSSSPSASRTVCCTLAINPGSASTSALTKPASIHINRPTCRTTAWPTARCTTGEDGGSPLTSRRALLVGSVLGPLAAIPETPLHFLAGELPPLVFAAPATSGQFRDRPRTVPHDRQHGHFRSPNRSSRPPTQQL